MAYSRPDAPLDEDGAFRTRLQDLVAETEPNTQAPNARLPATREPGRGLPRTRRGRVGRA